MRGPMNFKLKTAAAALLAVGLVASTAYAGESDRDPSAPAKKHAKTAAKKEACDACDQIQALKTDMQSQIDALKADLATKNAQLQQAQQAAADAKAAADRAEAAATSQGAAVTENAAAVNTLQSTVTDLKGNQASLATTVSDETAKIKKAIDSPDVLHYKGVAITPGGFTAGETIYRTKATGGDIPTAFSALPYEGADAYSLGEFFGSARQSRLSLNVEGKTNWGTLRGYYEADFLGTGITSNNNQSNSYVLRQRVIWGSAETNSHLKFAGGQMWSLATEDRKGISNESGDILTPLTIDPNYVTGFVWTRQYGFRVVKTFKNVAFGIAAENPQVLYTASLAGNTPYAVLGSSGQNGGNYNAAVSASVPTTYIQNYSNQKENDSAGGVIDLSVPVYNTIYANTNIANLSFNVAPDLIGKITFDPGWGHYEIFGIGRFAHETVYPGVTTNSTKYGGQKDIATGAAVVASSTVAGAYENSIALGGGGGSLRVPLIANKLTFGAKGLFGPGVGRYGDTTLSDVTANAAGELVPIHNVSGLLTVEANPTPRLALYLNYGGDYAGREDYGTGGTFASTLGSPSAEFCPTTAGAFACTSSPTSANIAAGGSWGGHWGTPSVGTTAVGYGSRLLSNSSCNTIASPGYSGSSTGYYPGGSCGAQTRDVQEITGGWWYDIYKGEHGRFRQGFQYGYAVREGWSGAPLTTGAAGVGAKGIDNMFWTSLRYYLP
jgi:hypothetical protein